ncbi:Cytochrome P450 OS=Tsukamurella paurometabola (strain ATCC 8368 / DSM / CCUG 35730 / CIP 100753/ JCM 10117 / KCTC 9821 / NBRC 16120 / NCIMB 702349 / NCTC 13040) OX=521096 GN=Tpau_3776 PE=3 SV=1 [Tsukamurella paurometabola]|uniref:Cytochrome P450 n=1 Tax=Tsukamurella paurometabola (strain ATCC 8368 / DSM 20162 / CCUG 35730 / CIP 100753 / JCM 10117 / KCTC 9821 / NBRC 16120 / NCIMB 702349 / NCTC 13040) TaxID=521096 RepID=D5UYQ1_TSUPD|nr:cytochrome P450 [Tsukamurella paurometabola]ADG80354.1 cytochrome P450 [Tsukamurella paurometabola DSM 20162]SUP39339.1 Cytochrome P450 107B1 [Tsukamurella paurometabola]
MHPSAAPARFPLHGDAYYRAPHTVFDTLTAAGPVHPVDFPAVPAWLVTGYDAAVSALTDERLGKDHSRGNARWRARASVMAEPQHSRLQAHLLHQDPPRHTVMRALVTGAFTARRTEQQRPSITRHVAELIDALPASGTVDLVSAFAAQLPLRALADAIGLPADLVARFDPAWGGVVAPVGPDDPRRPRYEELLLGLEGYIAEVMDRFASGGGDPDCLLGKLVAAEESGEIDRDELRSMIFQLLAAGQDPVTNQLALSILALLEHPAQLDELRTHPDRIDAAVEELLRRESAFVLTTWRFFDRDTEFGGHTVPAGDSVIVSLMAANRDPARFDCPHAVDLQRSPNPHLAFGHGAHYCPAAALARIELQEALGAVLRRLDGLRLACTDADLEFFHAPLARGVRCLPVSYDRIVE